MNNAGLMQRFLSLEEQATGRSNLEREFVLYARVDMAWLQSAASEIEVQEQWEVRFPATANGASGRQRIRKTLWPGVRRAPEYVRTTKTKVPTGGENEVAERSSDDAFVQFQSLSERGMYKHRHLLACPGHLGQWEVDVYFNADGTPHEWVKIDYELQEGEAECPAPHAQFKDVLRAGENEAFVRNLYETVFLKLNRPAA